MRPILIAAFGLFCAHASLAAEPVDVALVLVNDVSGSINENEYKLEKDGYFRRLHQRQGHQRHP